MSWEETLSDLVGLTGIPGAAHSYVRGVIITQAVRAGASANRIVQTLSQNGLGIRRTQALQMVAAEKERQAAGSTINQLDLGQSVGDVLQTPSPANWTGQYVHQVAAVYRSRDEEGNYLLHTRTMALKSSVLLTTEEAISAANDIINQAPTDSPGSFSVDPGDLLQLSLTGAWYDTQGRSLPQV